MPRNKESESIEETAGVPQRGQNPGRDPDDRKEHERADLVGRRDEHDDADEEELSEADLMEIDLDAPPDGEGPDA